MQGLRDTMEKNRVSPPAEPLSWEECEITNILLRILLTNAEMMGHVKLRIVRIFRGWLQRVAQYFVLRIVRIFQGGLQCVAQSPFFNCLRTYSCTVFFEYIQDRVRACVWYVLVQTYVSTKYIKQKRILILLPKFNFT